MSENDDDSEDDFDLWKLYTRDIEPWDDREKLDFNKKTKKSVKDTRIDTDKIVETQFASMDIQQMPSPGPEESAPQIDKRTALRLRRGQIPIEARIDLHGLYQAQAKAALIRFLQQAHGRGCRCVLVVTGKGKLILEGESVDERTPGVIKRSFKTWLAEEPLKSIVLKAQSALVKDGGQGAYYVLLRRKR